jgi:hypothetical protein
VSRISLTWYLREHAPETGIEYNANRLQTDLKAWIWILIGG